MKVLRLTTLLDFGGQERKYISFTADPNLLHHDYTFVALGYGGNAEAILKERGCKVIILDRNFSIRNLKNILILYKLFKKIKPDIVHTAAGEANFHGIIAAKLAGVNGIIGEEIGIPNHSKIARKVFSLVYRLADQVVCVSKAVKNYLIDTGEIKSDKGAVIYNPANAPSVTDTEKKTNAFEIVYVGRLEKVKNVEALLIALSEIKKRAVRLTLVGDGRERENLKNVAVQLGIEEKVDFVGFSDNPHQYLGRADLFVLPSFSEGFGIAVVEAMLMKVPVLCSNVGGIPEFVEDGRTGWLFDPHEQNELTSLLTKLVDMDKAYLKQIGLNGFESVDNVFTMKKYVQNLENLYERVYKKQN
ncbi:glycosyltransferase family 4 protein [Sphingobacterium sp. SGG-5]|uniref:glycosyltransferase n=1 Tax=Sphingobacterium sp. SGG-5 TaxID=2710881 RepID=UPI0013EA6E10|nr:glycosyltransferase [Sphingobacterium sp. SGG-5]NGM63423.1 glycosyltransferase family 4 protein [Sphingobacterium sp. SGG-5]